MRIERVVSVEDEDVLGARMLDAEVAGCRQAVVAPARDQRCRQPGIVGECAPDRLERPVRGRVVHDHQLEGVVVVRGHARDGLADHVRVVVDRQKHAHARVGPVAMPLPLDPIPSRRVPPLLGAGAGSRPARGSRASAPCGSRRSRCAASASLTGSGSGRCGGRGRATGCSRPRRLMPMSARLARSSASTSTWILCRRSAARLGAFRKPSGGSPQAAPRRRGGRGAPRARARRWCSRSAPPARAGRCRASARSSTTQPFAIAPSTRCHSRYASGERWTFRITFEAPRWSHLRSPEKNAGESAV